MTMMNVNESNERIDVSKDNKTLQLPDFDGNLQPMQLMWLEHLSGPLYEAGLKTIDYHQEGWTVWVVQLDPEKGFIPMFCTMYHPHDPLYYQECLERKGGEKTYETYKNCNDTGSC